MFKKVLSNTFSQVFSKIVTWLVAIFLISILTNYLSVEMYWLYSKVYNYTWIFVFLADLWLYAISIREISRDKENASKVVWNVMTLRLILGILILFLSLAIAIFLPWYNSSLALLSIFIASIFTIIQLINSSILSLMQAFMKIEFSSISVIIWKLVNVLWVAVVAYILFPNVSSESFFWPFIAIMLVGVLWIFINTILNYFYARKIAPIRFEFDLEYMKHLFKISLPYWIALFLSVVYFKVDVMFLSILEWAEKWDLSIAFYSLPMKIVEVIMVIWWFYMTSVLPSLSEAFKKKDNVFIQKILSISFKILFATSFAIFSMWILFREYIILIIANADYLNPNMLYNSSDAFLIVFFVVLFYFISLVFIYALVAAEKQSKLLKINIFITIFNIVWNLIMIPKYSFMWAWFVTLISQILLFIFTYFSVNLIVKISLPIWYILRVIVFWWLISLFWYYLISNYSIWLYIDFLLYGFILWVLYLLYFYLEYKIYKKLW